MNRPASRAHAGLTADQPGQFAIGHPQLPLPMQHIQFQRLPLQQAAARGGVAALVLVAQQGNDLMGQPLAQAAVLRVVIVQQRDIGAGFADQQRRFMAAIAAAQPGDLQLVVIQAAAHAILNAVVEQTPRGRERRTRAGHPAATPAAGGDDG